jgi:hypothetical protein
MAPKFLHASPAVADGEFGRVVSRQGVLFTMASPWPPPRDLDLRAAARTLAGKIAADPSLYGIDPATAAELVAASDAFDAALAIALAPDTRTRSSVSGKNMVRGALLKTMRGVGGRVRAHPGVTSEQLHALGMVVPDVIKTPIAAPAAQAAVHIAQIARLAHKIRVGELGASRRALPRGTVGYAVLCAVHAPGEQPPPMKETGASRASARVRLFASPTAGRTPASRRRFSSAT